MSSPRELYGRHWSEAEYIVVLWLYLQHRGEPRHHLRDYVKDASKVLGRTPGAIVMRMENFASIDPEVGGARKGLVNLPEIGKRLFAEWAAKPSALKDCAEVLLRDMSAPSQPSLIDPEPVRLPQAFGRYELLDPLGEGAFGAVYSCIDTETEKVFAIKIIKAVAASSGRDELLGRCRREIKALKTVSHPGVVQIYEDNLDSEKEFPGFVMELAVLSLAAYLDELLDTAGPNRKRPVLTVEESSVILNEVMAAASALHTHASTIIHRDINPNNILRLECGKWVLADFSLAKFLTSNSFATSFATTHHAWGTAHYTAPEQWRNFSASDSRADIYSLGVLIWELMSNTWPPFDRAHLELPSALENVVLRATERDPEARFQSVAELAEAYNSAVTN